MITFRILGVIKEAESGIGLTGLFVKAYDKDLLFDDLLGSTYTKEDGRFEIVTEAEDFRDFFDKRPDIYLKIFTPDTKKLLHSTKDAVRWEAGRIEEFKVLIPREKLGKLAPGRKVRMIDNRGEERTNFDVGESLSVRIEGVQPATAHEIVMRDVKGKEMFTVRLMSDSRGNISDFNLWPYIGLEDPKTGETLTVEEANKKWGGRTMKIDVRLRQNLVASQKVRIAKNPSRPLLLSTDEEGRLASGFVAGECDAVISGYKLPFKGTCRVFMVESQQDWRPGDPFRPVQLASGREAVVDVEVGPSGSFRVRLARRRELRPGAYDFIVRQLRYGYEDDEDLVLRTNDVVTRTVTGLVVRQDFMASKVVRGGCVNMLEIAGRSITGRPYFRYANTFQVGEDIWAALDPAALDPGLHSKMVALYVVQHKTAAQWSADSSLNHLAVLGGNSAVQIFKVQPSCINYDKRLIWPNASDVGEYDVIADFGNNTTNAASFAPDNTLDSPLDIIDGYFVPGFRVVPDPTTDTQFPHAGSFEYSEGTVTVTDDYGSYTVEKKAVVYFPADAPGATQPSQISSAQASYPLVIVVHGNSSAITSYQGYNYLLEHLAKNGFISASIHLNPGMHGTGRARMLFENIGVLQSKFGSKLTNNIGIMGHSRGGEAVVIAARLNHQESLGHNINAIISLAPTDQYTNEVLGGAWATPYLVIYGSMDGDVAGGWGPPSSPMNTGFALYDRANGAEKCMVFVYGSTHGRYNTVWGDVDLYFGKIGSSDMSKLISANAHQTIAKGYMTAFFRRHLLNQTQWDGIFKGEWTPAAVEQVDGGSVKLYIQYEGTTRREVDNFQGAHSATSWTTSTIGGSVSDDNTLPVDPDEDELRMLDTHSPHDTGGLLLKWDGTSDKLRFTVPAGQRDVSSYNAVCFRVTQKVGSSSNPAGLAQDLYLTLKDGGGSERAIKVSRLGEIPAPHWRHYPQYTKSAMNTVRIPLSCFTIKVAGANEVDLTNVEELRFDFGVKTSGEIEIDSVEFSN
ncbi:MAG TPA: hypothetical protein ENJ35_10995 [Gammaproteobacteria bacterium]|nr:hypothetical protein [Gammaproteobacteria bacterium]